MARYTREEILHLRESPIIVFHTPPLPDWISAAAIATAAQNKSNRADKQNLNRNLRTNEGTHEESNSSSLPRSSRGDKHEASMNRNGRTIAEKFDRNEDRPGMDSRRSDRDRAERLDSSVRTAREPKKPDDALENFGSRRARNADGSLTSRNARSRDPENEFVFRASLKTKTTQPEWLSRDVEPAQENDDAAGKTVDDFERWKQSMKKNDGSGDTGLPPLKDDASTSEPIHVLKDEDEAPKDVKPPPGFANVLPQPPTEHAFDTPIFSDLFSGSKEDVRSSTNVTSSPLPPGFSTNPLALSGQSQTSAKSVGTSKFSKFFGQSSQTQTSQDPKPADAPSRQSNSGPDLFSSLMAPKTTGDKDDAEGFERILAMLSSQSVPGQRKSTQADSVPQPPAPPSAYYEQMQHVAHDQSRNQMPQTAFRGQKHESMQHQQPGRHDSGPQAASGFAFPPQNLNTRPLVSPQYERAYNNGPYSPERTNVPAMRDSGNGAGTIMNHHTQNQDFFSSLLSNQPQNRPYTESYGSARDHIGSALSQKSVPPMSHHARDHSAGHRHPFDHRDPHLLQGSYNMDDQYQQRSRQQPNQSQGPQHHAAQRPRDELEFLNQLMAEQRMNTNQYSKGPYPSSSQQALRSEHGQPQGFVTGIGSRPGPGWNGQFEIDPRIPNASQYRP